MKLLFENWRRYLTEGEVPNVNVVLHIKPSKIHGKGIFAGEPIPKGTDLGMSYIKNGEDNQNLPILGRYHNHSESPSCYSALEGTPEKKMYIRKLISMRDIEPGEEITVDYRLQPDLEQPGQWAD